MGLSPEQLADFRAQIEEYMVDTLKVYREVGGDDSDPGAISDGMGGFISTYNGAVKGKKLVHTYKCRGTVPRGSSSVNEENNSDVTNAYLRALLTVPWNADIKASDFVELTSKETGEVIPYEVKEHLPHSESISLRIIVVRINDNE